MQQQLTTLDHLEIGSTARVVSLRSEGTQRRRMLDLGLIAGTSVSALQRSPAGDPVAYFIRGAVIALRREDAQNILVDQQ